MWAERLPFEQFCQFVVYSPPTSAVYYKLHQGWTPDTHKTTDLIEWIKTLLCTNAGSKEEAQRARDEIGLDWRPGDPIPDAKPEAPVMTIADYIKLAGLTNPDEEV